MAWLALLIPAVVSGLPDISMEVYRFRTSESPYIEVALYIPGESMACDATSGVYGFEYTLLIKDAAGEVATANRYRMTGTGCPAADLVDVKRFALSPGSYEIEMIAADIADTLGEVAITKSVDLTSSDFMSDIQLLSVMRSDPEGSSSLHKSGLYLEPLPFRLYYPALRQVVLYHETYNTESLPGPAYVQYVIRPLGGPTALSEQLPAEIVTYKRATQNSINVHTMQIDISDLISGHYALDVTLYGGDKVAREKSTVFFSRLNPDADETWMENSKLNLETSFVHHIGEDSLRYYLKALMPVTSSMEVDIMNNLVRKGSEKAKRYFLHRYWTNRAGTHAEEACNAYMKVARLVDNKYRSGFGYGFETDRGHVFLKYGRPNDIIEVEDEPSAPPYEIWFYNQFPTTNQANVRFIFYNPSLVRNGHKLLHSTANGEVRNDRWEIELYRDALTENPGVNDRTMQGNFHRNARKYFENY